MGSKADYDRIDNVAKIVADLREFKKRDESGFWSHVEDLERAYLDRMDDREIEELAKAIAE